MTAVLVSINHVVVSRAWKRERSPCVVRLSFLILAAKSWLDSIDLDSGSSLSHPLAAALSGGLFVCFSVGMIATLSQL